MKKQLNLIYLLAIVLIFLSACNQNKLLTVTIMGETQVSEITDTSAVLTGTILEVGEDMQAYGHVWGENESPTTSNFNSEYTETVETFTDKLIDLNPETKYYIRPYAKDGDEIIYEASNEFTTLREEQVPELVTYNVTEISFTTATCGGNITNQGESEAIVRGVCWSALEGPTTADSYSQDGTGTGNFPSYLEDLTDNTIYYVRAYLTNSEGTFYGEPVSFTTLIEQPLVVVNENIVGYNSAIYKCEVTHEGSSQVSSRGICWNTSGNPTNSDNVITNGNGIGSYTSIMSDLTESTTYYV